MGQSSSSERRRGRGNSSYQQPQPHPYSYPPPPYPYAPNPPYYPHPPPPPPPPNYNPNSYSYQLAQGYNSLLRFLDSFLGRTTQHYPPPPPYYYGPQNHANGWWVPSPSPSSSFPPSSSSSSSSSLMPQYVEHQNAKTVKNDVNVLKDTIRFEADGLHPDQFLVSFTFDAVVDGSVTIYYFAQEGTHGEFSPIYKDIYTPKKFPFQKGFGQKFCQPSGSGIDLGFFELDDLAKPLNGEVFPLVIYAAASPQPLPTDEHVASSCAQATQAVIQKAHDGSFQAKAIKQILWANGARYELQEIFGLVNSAEAEAESQDDNADDIGKECVICLTEPRNTTVLPCRHMCMCSECAKALRLQSNKCPICRQPIEKLLEINVNRSEH